MLTYSGVVMQTKYTYNHKYIFACFSNHAKCLLNDSYTNGAIAIHSKFY